MFSCSSESGAYGAKEVTFDHLVDTGLFFSDVEGPNREREASLERKVPIKRLTLIDHTDQQKAMQQFFSSNIE